MDDGRIPTERLILRPWRDEDLAPFAALNADPEVMEHFPARLSRAESDALAGRIRAAFAGGLGLFAVELPGEAAFAGFCGLMRPAFEAHFTPEYDVWRRLADTGQWSGARGTRLAGQNV